MNRRDREVTDITEIKKILDTCKVIRLGLHDGDDIYILPLNYGYTLKEDSLTFYMHGGNRGKKLELIRQCQKAAFELDCGHQLISGERPCQYGFAYSSMLGKGTVELVTNPLEKMEALTILMECQTGKHFEFNEKLVSIVSVMKLTVSEFSAKHRPVKRF